MSGKRNDQIIHLVDRLINYRQASTAMHHDEIRSNRHNDFLCPTLQRQLNTIAECVGKHYEVAYDIQGITDRGTDVFLRLNDDDTLRYVCFQIKSYDDLSKGDYLAKIKAQFAETMVAFGTNLKHYYLILYTSLKDHMDKVRQIKSAFAQASNVTVVDPQYALPFFSYDNIKIEAIVELALREEDVVVKKAKETILDFSPTEACLAIEAASAVMDETHSSMTHDGFLQSSFLLEAYERFSDRSGHNLLPADSRRSSHEGKAVRPIDERLAEDIDNLAGNLFVRDTASGNVSIVASNLISIQYLLIDGILRYGYDKSESIRYVYELLEIEDRAERGAAAEG